jgi:hypothetical protein
MPLNFSPDVHHTPIRHKHAVFKAAGHAHSGTTPTSSINRLLLPTRTSPRKRLQLTDSPPKPALVASSTLFLTPSPEKINKRSSPVTKRNRAQAQMQGSAVAAAMVASPAGARTPDDLNSSGAGQRPGSATLMKGLSPAQLIKMVSKLVEAHPELEQEVGEILPRPDLGPLEEKLLYCKRNIFKSLPNTRLESKTDSMAYNRASTHLLVFKKTLQDQAKFLHDAQQWEALLDYCFLAWTYVKSTPVWDNPPHNNVRKQCFKSLSVTLSTAVKKGEWRTEAATEMKKKFEPLVKDAEEMSAVIKQMEQLCSGNVLL